MRHRLVSTKTGDEVRVGEIISDRTGSYGRLLSTQPPNSFNPYGYIVVNDRGATVLYYPSAYDLEFVSESDLDAVENLTAELESDLEESTRRLVS